MLMKYFKEQREKRTIIGRLKTKWKKMEFKSVAITISIFLCVCGLLLFVATQTSGMHYASQTNERKAHSSDDYYAHNLCTRLASGQPLQPDEFQWLCSYQSAVNAACQQFAVSTACQQFTNPNHYTALPAATAPLVLMQQQVPVAAALPSSTASIQTPASQQSSGAQLSASPAPAISAPHQQNVHSAAQQSSSQTSLPTATSAPFQSLPKPSSKQPVKPIIITIPPGEEGTALAKAIREHQRTFDDYRKKFIEKWRYLDEDRKTALKAWIHAANKHYEEVKQVTNDYGIKQGAVKHMMQYAESLESRPGLFQTRESSFEILAGRMEMKRSSHAHGKTPPQLEDDG